MTVCTFYNGTLYSDRAGVANSAPSYYVEMKKLFVSPCSRVAMAISGHKMPPNFETSKEIKLITNYVLSIKGALRTHLEVPKELELLIADRHILLLTKDRLYKYCNGFIIEMDKDIISTVGTGGKCLTIALIAGKGIMEAFRIASECDPASYMTDIDSIAQAALL